MQYFVSTFSSVCLAKNVLAKSIRSGMTLLFASAQKEVNSKLLLVFSFFVLPVFASLIALYRVLLEYYLVLVPLDITKICTYSKRPQPAQKESR